MLTGNRLLSLPGSAKEVREFRLDTSDGGLTYHAGDALGVRPRNHPDLVGEWTGELGDLQRDGTLTQLDLAFSRDQRTRVYVQDRMREHGAQLVA